MLKQYIQLARLHRPQAIGLLLLPGWWGIAAADPGHPNPYMLVLFALGAVLMRSAGCIYNDMVDCTIDREVARTRLRPLAEGTLNHTQAAAFLLALLGLSAGILSLMPPLTLWLGIGAVVLVASYPWMKRITYWPQAFLGLTFNWGALMGWSAIRETLETPTLLLYMGGFFWTLVYDTIYAHQDKYDDLKLGVGSTALRFLGAPRLFLSICALLSVVFFALAGASLGLHYLYFISVIGVGLHYIWQICNINFEDGQDCAQKFIANVWVGWILFLGLLVGRQGF
jgi:4-hydroxybenzoate polyprenyltransferase